MQSVVVFVYAAEYGRDNDILYGFAVGGYAVAKCFCVICSVAVRFTAYCTAAAHNKDGKQYMTLGTELFTPFNDVENNVFSVTDNVTINKGNHLITAGATFERQYFMNSYLRAPYGYYRYASMDDFMTGEKPMLYGITYGYNGCSWFINGS